MAVQREPFGMFLVMVDPDSKFEKLLGVAAMAPYFIMCAPAPVSLDPSSHASHARSQGGQKNKRTHTHTLVSSRACHGQLHD